MRAFAWRRVDGQGGMTISIIEDRGGAPPPDLTDDKWDHGSGDGEGFTVVKKGRPPDYFMARWEGRAADDEIWKVNYMKQLSHER